MFKKTVSLVVALACATIFWASTAHADYYSSRILLKEGMRHSEVVRLQNDLKSLGYFYANSTGYFGPITKQAVINYQRDRKLLVDGIVGPQTARQIKVDRILATAMKYIGVPYQWGGTSPKGFDCSGFTHYVMLQHNVIIPRVARNQYYDAGTWVAWNSLKPGDLVFFTTYAPGPSHVGIYIGNNQFIHSSSSKGVVISSLTNTYYATRYIGAKRVI